MKDRTRIPHLSFLVRYQWAMFCCRFSTNVVIWVTQFPTSPAARGTQTHADKSCPDTGERQQLPGQKCKSFPDKRFAQTQVRFNSCTDKSARVFPDKRAARTQMRDNSCMDKSARVFLDKRASRTQMRDNSWLDKSTRAYLDKIFTWTQVRDNSCMDKRAKVFPDKRASRTQVRLTVTRTKVPEFSRTRELPGHRWETRVMHGQCLFVHIYVVRPNVP